MILPIVAYGHPTLKMVAKDIDKDFPGLEQLLTDMWETLAHSEGVGLAAPQVNQSIRLFLVDANPFYPDYPDAKGFKQVFINAQLVDTFGEEVPFKEGCLSLPGIYEEVMRPDGIRLRYLDENFEEHEETFTGFQARIVQHEYDHLEGHVFTDRISPIRKTFARNKLAAIAKGKVGAKYKYRRN